MDNFITGIYIEKIRNLKNIHIDIDCDERKHLIITGKNGSGKTSLLEKIRGYLQVIPDGNLMDLLSSWKNALRYSENEYNTLKVIENRSLEEQNHLENHEDLINFYIDNIKKYADGIEIRLNDVSNINEKYLNGEFILAYFNATRNIKIEIPTNVPKIELQDKYNIQENIGNMFLSYLVYLKTQQSFARNEEDMDEVNKIQEWFDKFENSLRTLFEDESITLKFDYRNLNFIINQEGREPYGFDVLSDGYSAVLDIVINLILRMEKQHKQAYDIEGIVIIDELENHLHIGLQKKILPFLTEFFPNIQFIISTHSPFIINSVDNAVIYDLERKHRVEDLSGLAYEGVVEGYFDINQYSEIIKEKLARYNFLVENDNKSTDEEDEEYELRSYLKSISPELSPEVVLAFNTIELNRKSKKRQSK